MKKRNLIKLLPALAALLIGGCTEEDPLLPRTPAGDEATITAGIPGLQAPSTRSIAGGGGEASLASVDILVFKPAAGGAHELVQHVRGNSILPTGGADYQVQFKAKLQTNADASTVVLVANVPDVAARIGSSTDKRAVLSLLSYASSNPGGTAAGWKWKAGASDYTPIPMYGEYAIASGGVKAGMKIEGVQLCRMLARIDIENQAQGFTLSDVYLVNYNTAGYVAPAWDTSTGDILRSGEEGYPYDTNAAPRIPPSPGARTGEGNALRYTYTSGGLRGEIYTYEAAAAGGTEGAPEHAAAPCLIVSGAYDGNLYYYRVDFTAGTDAAGKKPGEAGFNPATVQYMPLYRNHCYDFTISQVSGPGYSTFAAALASPGLMNNLKTDLLVVDERNIRDIVYNGRYYLGTGGEVIFGPFAPEDIRVACTTNHPEGWQIDAGKGTSGIEYTAGGAGWLQASKEGAETDMKSNLKLKALTANGGGAMREAWVHLKAGTLAHKVKVTQDYATVRVTPDVLLLPASALTTATNNAYTVKVACTDSRGNEVPDQPWTLTSAAPQWLTLSLTQGGPGTAGAGGTGSRTVYVFAPANTSTTEARSAALYKDGDPSDVAVNVTQAYTLTGGGTPVPGNTYVGAFWRADQTGERLIRITTPDGLHGAWSAYVSEYGDDFAPGEIVFSGAPSSDPGIYTGNAVDMIANDAAYQVSGNDRTVAGTTAAGGDIFFRIGLKGKWSDNPAYDDEIRPARYAVVMISYNNHQKYQKLFLRQGHEADYLMRPQDNNAAGNLHSLSGGTPAKPRPEACKFTPYNLTHPDLKDGTNTGGTMVTDHPAIPPRISIPEGAHEDYFTAYPSQAGAFFQWANANQPRRAYHPANPTGIITNWQNNYPNNFWNSLRAIHETCPPGYRRPNDGTITQNSNATVAFSEMRQSLWLNPQGGRVGNADNSVWGYYADGFFDRREISDSDTGHAGTAVATGTANVAYTGRLFFNPTTNASLFIPASGYRNYTTGQPLSGQLREAGEDGSYWTSSVGPQYGWLLNVRLTDFAGQIISSRIYGFTVRCVRE